MTINATMLGPLNNGLAKLVLQTAHSCNLRCVYCISDAGKWGKNEITMMSPEMACNIVEKFALHYKRIQTIYFFGGEPALNLSCMESVAKKCQELVEKEILQSMPYLTFSTNGTIASDEFVRIVNTYGFNFNVSIDGPPEIHDKLRLGLDNSGTYERIKQNIKKLKKLTGKPYSLELTYTVDHIKSGWSLWDILKFLHRETDVSVFAINTAINTSYANLKFDPVQTKEEAIKQFTEAARNSLIDLATSDNPIVLAQTLKIIRLFSNQHELEFCPAGREYFSVAWNGDIYPCQNIPETKDKLITNINNPDLLNAIFSSDVVKNIVDANENAKKILSSKWYGRYCRICPADNMSETGSIINYSPFRHELQAKIAFTVAHELTEIAKDDKKYFHLIDHLGKMIDTGIDD